MIQKFFSALLVLMILSGCSKTETKTETAPESPDAALQTIIGYYEAGDFDALIRTRYAEIGKAKDESEIQKLIDRLNTGLQDAEKKAAAVAEFRKALETEPEMSDDGSVATYKLGERFLKLSRMPSGLWGFHM